MLERKLIREILNVLYYQGQLSLSELTKAVNGNWETVLRRIEELRSEGLVYSQKAQKFPFKRVIMLTNKGREIASVLIGKTRYILEADERILLAMLYAMNGELKGSTKLEKLMYRIHRETNFKKCFKFVSYKYGPFSIDVLKTARTLAFVGFLNIEEKIWEVEGDLEKKIVIYRLTPEGQKVAKDIFSALPEDIKKKLSEFKIDARTPLEVFLKKFYEKYPEFKRQTKLDAFLY
jgi:predicted transcriptional regulator